MCLSPMLYTPANENSTLRSKQTIYIYTTDEIVYFIGVLSQYALGTLINISLHSLAYVSQTRKTRKSMSSKEYHSFTDV